MEQAQAGQVAAEQEAASLRTQLAAAEERAQKADAMAALREAARTDGELAGLRSQVAGLKSALDSVTAKVEQSYGESGVSVHDGVAHGSGASSGSNEQAQQFVIEQLYWSFAGQVDLVRAPIQSIVALG